jgi:hypothetical protein
MSRSYMSRPKSARVDEAMGGRLWRRFYRLMSKSDQHLTFDTSVRPRSEYEPELYPFRKARLTLCLGGGGFAAWVEQLGKGKGYD